MHTLLVGVPLLGPPGLMEWVIIGLAIVIFFGAAKLPKLGKGLGEGIRNFKKGIKGELEEEGGSKDENSKLTKAKGDGQDEENN